MTKKRGWLTPDTPAPETVRGRVFEIANDPLLVGAVSGALLDLTRAENWEDFGTMAAADVAELMNVALEAFLNSDGVGGGPCIRYRRSPTTGRFEQSDDGETWEETTGDEAISEPGNRAEDTTEQRKCAAATNAAYVLYLLYVEALDLLEASVPLGDAYGEISNYVGELLEAAIGLVLTKFAPIVGWAWSLFYGILEVLQLNVWSADFNEALVCILKEKATDTDGVITFNFAEVRTEIGKTYFNNVASMLLIGQVIYLLEIIGPQGLNLAGATTAVPGDCDGCGEWCYYIDNLQQAGFTLARGYFNAAGDVFENNPGGGWGYDASLVVDTSECMITRVSFYHQQTSYTGTLAASVLPSAGPISNQFTHVGGGPITFITDDNAAWYTNSGSSTIRLWKALDGSNHNSQVNWVKIYGTGPTPFGASNCP